MNRRVAIRAAMSVLGLALAIAGVVVIKQIATETIDGEAQPAVSSQDEQNIRDTVTQVAIAQRNADRDGIAALMCPDDAQDYLDATYDPGPDAGLASPITSVDVRWVAVRIVGTSAAATFETEYSNREVTVYLSKIDGAWLMCEDAEDAMAAADSSPATPTD